MDGAILSPGKRTVSSALNILGVGQQGNFAIYHHGLSRARWSPLQPSRALMLLVAGRLGPSKKPLVFGIDKTVERRWGRKIAAKVRYRDPVRSQETNMVSKGDFIYRGGHLVCPQSKMLRRSAVQKRDRAHQYVAHQRDCQACPVKAECLPPNQKRRYVAFSMHDPRLLRARKRNQTSDYHREKNRRQTIAEGTFASLDRLGWARSRLRGLWKFDCEGYMAGLAHNVLKAVRPLCQGSGTPGPLDPGSIDPGPHVSPKERGIPSCLVRPNGFPTTASTPVSSAIAF